MNISLLFFLIFFFCLFFSIINSFVLFTRIIERWFGSETKSWMGSGVQFLYFCHWFAWIQISHSLSRVLCYLLLLCATCLLRARLYLRIYTPPFFLISSHLIPSHTISSQLRPDIVIYWLTLHVQCVKISLAYIWFLPRSMQLSDTS